MIQYATDSDFERYEAFLTSHPNGHFLQSLRWARFKSKLPHRAIMSVDENGEIRGCMTMFVQQVPHLRAKYLYSPRGPVCDRGDADTLSELLFGAASIASEVGAYKLTFDPDVTERDETFLNCIAASGAVVGENAEDNNILQPFAVFRIDIKGKTDDELLAMFHSKARYSVRSSLKSGAVCRIGDKKDIPAFRALLEGTAKRDGFTARGLTYFNEMYDALAPDMFKLFIVECDGAPIAGSVLIRYGEKTWHLYGGSDEQHKDKLANFLMQWEMIRWSISESCSLYDMRGVAGEGDKLTPLEGLFRFKKRFGGELVTFVGRIDILYDKKTDKRVKSFRRMLGIARRIAGRK